ncbi:MAG: cyclase family protein, partial [Acidimicrobiia bacterium]
PVSEIARGDAANVSELRLGSHTGTHVDPPRHFLDDGAGVDELSLEALIGPALVVDLTYAGGPLGPDDLDALDVPPGTERLLLKTSNSALWAEPRPTFPDRYVALSPEGAAWVVGRGLRLLGTDFLSIERKGAPGHPTHVALLCAGVVVVEGLDLSKVSPGPYTFVCLPLRVAGGDGAPARAVLL